MWSRVGGYLRQHHLALLCLFLVLGGGTAWALERNSVRSKHIVDEQVRSADMRDGSLGVQDIADTQTSTLYNGLAVAANACEDIVMPAPGIHEGDAVLVLPNRNDGSESDWDSRLILAGYGPRDAQTETTTGGTAVPVRICNTSNENVENARLVFTVLGFSH